MSLQRSDPVEPGFGRRKHGKGFVYLGLDGRLLDDPSEKERIRSLVIPPAWKDVWICPDPDGHIQAIGTDAAGRRQYLYHEAWREQRDRDDSPELLAHRTRDGWHDVTTTDINDFVRDVTGGDFTATDFRTWHATVLAAVGLAVSVRAGDSDTDIDTDTNTGMDTGVDIDMDTGAARKGKGRGSETARKRAVVRVVKEVASYLGNTPAVARASYIDPRIIDLYEEGRTIAPALGKLGVETAEGELATQGPAERAVLDLLRAPD